MIPRSAPALTLGASSLGRVRANTPVRSEPSQIGAHMRIPSGRSAVTTSWVKKARPAIVDATFSLFGSSLWAE